jgi:Protein of unknown function (DUF2442)
MFSLRCSMNGNDSMVTLTDAQFRAANARGREMLKTEPRAITARFDRKSGRVIVDLINGCTYIFPAAIMQDFQDVDPAGMDEIIVEGMGFNLNWPKLDVDLYVPALVAGIFGTKAWMEKALARRAGQAKSPAKAAASRANGAKGGRPRKAAGGHAT